MSNKRNQELLDSMITRAGYQLLEDEAKRADTHQEAADIDTAALDRRMDKVIARTQRQQRRIKTRKVLVRAAAAVLVVMVAYGIAVASSDAFRVQIFGMSYKADEISASIDFDSDEESGEHSGLVYVAPTYIPNGYELAELTKESHQMNTRYVDADGSEIIITQKQRNASFSIDVDAQKKYEVTIRGREAFVTESEGLNILVASTKEYTFMIQSPADVGELIKVMDSLLAQ